MKKKYLCVILMVLCAIIVILSIPLKADILSGLGIIVFAIASIVLYYETVKERMNL